MLSSTPRKTNKSMRSWFKRGSITTTKERTTLYGFSSERRGSLTSQGLSRTLLCNRNWERSQLSKWTMISTSNTIRAYSWCSPRWKLWNSKESNVSKTYSSCCNQWWTSKLSGQSFTKMSFKKIWKHFASISRMCLSGKWIYSTMMR